MSTNSYTFLIIMYAVFLAIVIGANLLALVLRWNMKYQKNKYETSSK